MKDKRPVITLLTVASIATIVSIAVFQWKSHQQSNHKTKLTTKISPQQRTPAAISKSHKPQTNLLKTKIKTKKMNNIPANIAPIPASKKEAQTYNGRQLSSTTESELKELKIVNSFNPNWEKNYLKNIQRSFFDEKVKVEIKHLRSLVYVKFKEGRLAEKVKVAITRENGRQSSYTALIDSETGAMINSWNASRYEFRDSVSLNGKGAEFPAQ